MSSFNEFLKRRDPRLQLEVATIGGGLNAGVGAAIGADVGNAILSPILTPASKPFAQNKPAATTPNPAAQQLMATAAGVAGALQNAQTSLKQSADALAKLGITKK